MKNDLNILLIGSGGRESALAKKLSESRRTQSLYVAPGNAGTAKWNVELNISNFDKIREFCEQKEIDMIVVGPEQPLVDGITDFFKDTSIKIVGPDKEGAKLEGSKEFAKEFMFQFGIPSARFMSVTEETINQGFNFINSLTPPIVLKANGLAAGKGVLIIEDKEEAKNSLSEMLNGLFGEASKTVVIEEFLNGIECSVFVLTDGESYKVLPVAKDYKRIGEGDTGLNTGGMGAVSPVPFADDIFMKKVEEQIIVPTLKGLKAHNIDYRGFIFLGLMNVEGNPYVIEYNVRMGDPETEVVIPRIESDIVDLLEGVVEKNLAEKEIKISHKAAVTVMLVSKGYPGSYEKGFKIDGIEKAEQKGIVFHAGTSIDKESGRAITSGGRVISLTALADNAKDALSKALSMADDVAFTNKYYRKDIGLDLKL